MSSPVDKGVDEDFKKLKALQELEAQIQRLTGQLENKERELQALSSKEVKVDSMLKDESPQSTVLKMTKIALQKSLQELPEYLQSTRECSLSNKNARCKTPEPALFWHTQGPFIPSISEPLTPLQKFKEKTPHIQMTLVKEYLTVLNTTTEEELLQLQGIGPKRAARVLELRQQCQDPFNDVQDLKDIGIGKKELISEFAKTM